MVMLLAMFLMFISVIKDIKEEITISINTLMEAFQTKGNKKVLSILKSLEEKGYIEIIKIIGKTNKYRIITVAIRKNSFLVITKILITPSIKNS